MSAENNLITALIPTYQRPLLLNRAIRGVLNQKKHSGFIKVFDDDPSGSLPVYLSELIRRNPRIIYSKNNRNLGEIRNYRCCFESVETPYFSVQSDDDFILPNFYEDALSIFSKFKDIGFVLMETLKINIEYELLHSGEDSGFVRLVDVRKPCDLITLPHDWTGGLFRSELAGLFSECLQYEHDVGFDMRCLLRAMSRYNFAVYYRPGALYTLHKDTTSFKRSSVEEGTAYYTVQLMRHVDIINDKDVCIEQKQYHQFLLRKKRRAILYFKWVKLILLDILRSLLASDGEDISIRVARNIRALRVNENCRFTAFLLGHIYSSLIIKFIVRTILRGPYLLRTSLERKKMSKVKAMRYLELFVSLHAAEQALLTKNDLD